jgi:hypothetical protein
LLFQIQLVPLQRGTVPVAIVSGSEWEEVAEELDDTFLGDAEVWRRGGGCTGHGMYSC